MHLDLTHETNERAMLLSLAARLPQPLTFFDVGANVGSYSIPFAERFPDSWVYAFEPIPSTNAGLYANVMDIPNIVTCLWGLSDDCRLGVEYHVSAMDSGATSLAPLEEDRFGPIEIVRGDVSTLDRAGNIGVVPSIVKCDVEGAELLVFRGGKELLAQRHPLIQCELHRRWSARFHYHPNDLIAFLAGFGYACYRLDPSDQAKLQIFPEMTDDVVETNFYFLHQDQHRSLLP